MREREPECLVIMKIVYISYIPGRQNYRRLYYCLLFIISIIYNLFLLVFSLTGLWPLEQIRTPQSCRLGKNASDFEAPRYRRCQYFVGGLAGYSNRLLTSFDSGNAFIRQAPGMAWAAIANLAGVVLPVCAE